MEQIFTGKTRNEAEEQAYAFFTEKGFEKDAVSFEVIEQPVKKLFVTKGEYKLKAYVEEETEKVVSAEGEVAPAVKTEVVSNEKIRLATAYLTKVLNALGAENFTINPVTRDDLVVLDIVGDKLGIVIGRRGETLDSLQYLAILASNRNDEPYCRISVDCNGYREKRKETLENLATRTAQKVLKQGRRIALEPMNPYERRIIHSKVAEIDGVSSHSQGEEPYRKVVISSNVRRPESGSPNRDHGDRNDRGDRRRGPRGNSNAGRSYKQSSGFSTSFEREYKRTPSEPVEYSQETVDLEKDESTSLYGKIEL